MRSNITGMVRLCERPACSERGAVAYGFDPARLLVWLSPLDPDADRMRAGVLCIRHADAMVVPLGWTLDDARDPTPRLFVPASSARRHPTRTANPRRLVEVEVEVVEQLELGRGETPTTPTTPTTAVDSPASIAPDAAARPSVERTVAAVTGVSSTDDPDTTVAIPWLPHLGEEDNDLDGVLRADTQLLARAFRGTDRPR
ncbi:hypothetical protein BH24ACT5_BH24ACT5_01350 [soil metagenome]